MDGGDGIVGEGKVTCATWIKRPENAHLVLIGKSSKPCSSLEIFSFDPKTTSLSSSPKVYFFLLLQATTNVLYSPKKLGKFQFFFWF